MDDIRTTYDKKYFTFTSLEKEINLKETSNDLDAYDENRRRKEFRRCSNDFAYFCHKYVKIDHPVKGIIPLVLYNHQRRAFNLSMNNRFAGFVKPRQMGFSTLFEAWGLWRGLFRCNEKIMVVHKKDSEALSYMTNLKRMMDRLPKWLVPEMSRNNGHEITFTDSDVSIFSAVFQAACGRCLDWLIIPEAAYIPNMEQNWTAVFPTIATGGRCIAYSTHNIGNNWFTKLVKSNGSIDTYDYKGECFAMDSFSFREHPDYDSDSWAAQIESQLGARHFRMEVLCQLPETEKKPKVIEFSESEHLHIHVHHHYPKSQYDFSF